MKKTQNTKVTTKAAATKLSPESENTPIDTSVLKVGMVVKNYKALCELLNQPVTDGNSKKYQLKEFERYFDWEKSGQKFVIADIYDTPLSKEDLRKLGNNSIYVKSVEIILLQYLSKQKGYVKTLTKRDWWEILGFSNHGYGRIPEEQLVQFDKTITPFEVKHFYQRCNKRLEQILFSSLRNLSNRKLIEYEVQMVIYMEDENGQQVSFIANNNNEKKKILNTEREVLLNMGFVSMIQVFSTFRQVEFYHKVNALIEERYGWKGYYKQIEILYLPEYIQEDMSQISIQLQKEILNNKIVDTLNENAQNFYNKKLEEFETQKKELMKDYIGEIPKSEIQEIEKQLWKAPDAYIMAQAILTDKLIRIGHRNLDVSYDDFAESNLENVDNSFLWDK